MFKPRRSLEGKHFSPSALPGGREEFLGSWSVSMDQPRISHGRVVSLPTPDTDAVTEPSRCQHQKPGLNPPPTPPRLAQPPCHPAGVTEGDTPTRSLPWLLPCCCHAVPRLLSPKASPGRSLPAVVAVPPWEQWHCHPAGLARTHSRWGTLAPDPWLEVREERVSD